MTYNEYNIYNVYVYIHVVTIVEAIQAITYRAHLRSYSSEKFWSFASSIDSPPGSCHSRSPVLKLSDWSRRRTWDGRDWSSDGHIPIQIEASKNIQMLSYIPEWSLLLVVIGGYITTKSTLNHTTSHIPMKLLVLLQYSFYPHYIHINHCLLYTPIIPLIVGDISHYTSITSL